MPEVVDWAFEGLLGLMFIVTFLVQAGKRFGLVVVAQESPNSNNYAVQNWLNIRTLLEVVAQVS